MGKIIDFMEKLGASAEFQQLTEAEVIEMLQQQNLFESRPVNNFSQVEELLEVRKNLVCGIMPAEEPADEPVETPSDEPEKSE